jgi:hypothetical protein
MQLRQHRAWLDMSFIREKQASMKSSRQRRFKLSDAIGIEAMVADRQPRETLEVRPIARLRHDKRAVERRIGEMLAP